jgi:hypothetical protein
MAHYARKRDGNHRDVITALRQIGATTIDLADLGRGRPDIGCWYRDRFFLLEVKNPKGRNRVEPGQADWLASWPGPAAVVRSAEEAIRVVTLCPGKSSAP